MKKFLPTVLNLKYIKLDMKIYTFVVESIHHARVRQTDFRGTNLTGKLYYLFQSGTEYLTDQL